MNARPLLSRAAAVAALAAMAAGTASADTLSAQTRSGNFTFTSQQQQGPVNVPVAPGIFTSPVFAHIQGERLIVSYTAECAVSGPGTTRWLDLNIVARNVTTNAVQVLPPTAGTQDALCTSNGTPTADGWQMNAVNAVAANLPTGLYRIELQARLSGPGTGHLGDSSLIVWK